MINLAEFRRRPDRLTDRLPWAAIVRPGIILNKEGSFQQTIAYRGPDLDSTTPGGLKQYAAQLNNIFKRLTSGWALYAEAQRVVSDSYPDAKFNNVVPFLIDQERRCLFQSGQHFETNYYFTLVYMPPAEAANKLKKMLTTTTAKNTESDDYKLHLKNFESETYQICKQLSGLFDECRPLNDDETLTYLHNTISTKTQTVKMPDTPMYIDAYIADTPLIGGYTPKLGDHYIGVISILGFPGRTLPGLLDDLGKLNFKYRWTSRWIPIDKVDGLSEIEKYKKGWFSKRKGLVTLLKEQFTGTPSVMENSDASNKASDADAALQELSDDLVAYGYYTTGIVIMDPDPSRLEKKLQTAERIIMGQGLTSIKESMNTLEAYLGSIPCNCRANVRRPLLSSYNIAHILPTTATWAGPQENKHLKKTTGEGAVLLHALTGGSTPFRLSLHVSDVGHTLIIGPTGSGKTTLLNILAAQFLRYPKARIYTFDKGYTASALIAGVEGDHYDLGGDRGKDIAFQPLKDIDNEAERRWAYGWIINILTAEKINVDSEIKKIVWTALCSLATSPRQERTITGLTLLIQKTQLRDALAPLTLKGPYGKLLDADTDSLTDSAIQCFEMENLMNQPQCLPHVLDYLFHQIQKRLNGEPTQIYLDEAWTYLDSPIFAAKIREWLKELRKANASVIFASQSLDDVARSAIVSTLIESCQTKIFLPNKDAEQQNIAEVYKQFGLNATEIKLLAYAMPKKDYYYRSSEGSRLFDLGLQEFALAYCAPSREESQNIVPQLIQEHGKAKFNQAWLTFKGLHWAVDLINQEIEKEQQGGRQQ